MSSCPYPFQGARPLGVWLNTYHCPGKHGCLFASRSFLVPSSHQSHLTAALKQKIKRERLYCVTANMYLHKYFPHLNVLLIACTYSPRAWTAHAICNCVWRPTLCCNAICNGLPHPGGHGTTQFLSVLLCQHIILGLRAFCMGALALRKTSHQTPAPSPLVKTKFKGETSLTMWSLL